MGAAVGGGPPACISQEGQSGSECEWWALQTVSLLGRAGASSLGGGSQPGAGALESRRTEVLKLVEVLGKALDAKGQRPSELGASWSHALTGEGPCGHLAMSAWPARGASSWRPRGLCIASVTLSHPVQPAGKVLSKSHQGDRAQRRLRRPGLLSTLY